MKKKKKIILAIIMLFIAIFVIYIMYFFFGRKKYTFYMKDTAMEIRAIQIFVGEDTNQELDAQSVIIYKTEVINDIIEELKKVKMKPSFSKSTTEASKKWFSIILLGKDNQRLYYLGNEGEDKYFVDIGMEENGVVNSGIKELISYTSIHKEQGDKLYDMLKQVLEDNICEITISDIEKMSKEKIYDWNQFQQYLFTDIEAKEITRNGLTSNGTARFQIAEKKGYLDVVYFNGVIADSKGTNRYAEVLEAVVYKENGEEMDFYAEEISAFLEEIK